MQKVFAQPFIDGVMKIIIVSDDSNRKQGRFVRFVLLSVAVLEIAPQKL